MPSITHYELHTDGSCLGNPGPGGWGAVLLGPNRDPDLKTPQIYGEYYGGEPNSTNNRMELTAIIEALALEPEPTRQSPLQVHTDSQYVANAFNQNWLAGWQRNGWRTAKKEPVKNRELWTELLELQADRPGAITFHWVKGHAGNHWNEHCDRMAVRAANEAHRRGETFAEGSGCFAPVQDDPVIPATVVAASPPAASPTPPPASNSGIDANALLRQVQELEAQVQNLTSQIWPAASAAPDDSEQQAQLLQARRNLQTAVSALQAAAENINAAVKSATPLRL